MSQKPRRAVPDPEEITVEAPGAPSAAVRMLDNVIAALDRAILRQAARNPQEH